MARLTVRNVDDEIAAALEARAVKAGRSAEAEHRRILEAALRPDPDFFSEARARCAKLGPDAPATTDLLRRDRDRDAP